MRISEQTRSDCFQIAFVTRRVTDRRRFVAFLFRAARRGEDLNSRTIGEWADAFNSVR